MATKTIQQLKKEIIDLLYSKANLRSNVKADRNKADKIDQKIRQKEQELSNV